MLHNTFNHQNNLDRSATVPVSVKSSMVNMDCRESKQNHVGYPKDVFRQGVPGRRINTSGRLLQY